MYILVPNNDFMINSEHLWQTSKIRSIYIYKQSFVRYWNQFHVLTLFNENFDDMHCPCSSL